MQNTQSTHKFILMSKVSRQESFEEFQLTVLIKNSVLLCKTSVLNTTTVVKCTAKLYEVYVIYLILTKIFKVKVFNIFFSVSLTVTYNHQLLSYLTQEQCYF